MKRYSKHIPLSGVLWLTCPHIPVSPPEIRQKGILQCHHSYSCCSPRRSLRALSATSPLVTRLRADQPRHAKRTATKTIPHPSTCPTPTRHHSCPTRHHH